MNRVGLKDYLLNHADDNDLLDCAKAWDVANEYGQFDTYSSVEEAAQANGWDAAQALSEARRVNQDADFFRFNGYGHLETKQRIEFDAEQGDDFGEVSKYLGEFFNSGSVNQSEKINDSWGNSILVKGGNGRFCADLNEAHEYCQQFADSITGIGESLDDMCEDRSEIASAIQDAKVAERGQVDKRHDDSEIGE